MNVDLNLREKRFNNSSFWCLCHNIKKRTEEGITLIVKCLGKKPDIKSLNSSGYSVEDLLNERGTEEMKKIMEEMINE